MEIQKMSKTNIDTELKKLLESHKTIIKVLGTGGAGNNTVSRLMQIGLNDIQTYALNTDAQDLLFAQADNKILIGRSITNGLGAGGDPEVGENSALENKEEVQKLVTDTDLVFVTCGLGGGTGTGSAPVIAEIARETGALTISVVTLPFSEEGIFRWNNAQYGLEKLRENSDTLIVIQNDKLWKIVPEAPLDDAFKVADKVLVNAVQGITELVTQKGIVNLDFADIRAIMKDGGTALIGMAESDSPQRSAEAVEKAIENPLIDLEINGAQNALLNITGGKDMTVKDAKVAMQTLAQKLDKSAKIIWGSRIIPELNNKIRVMVIATGLKDIVSVKLFRNDMPEAEMAESARSDKDSSSSSLISESELYENDEKTVIEKQITDVDTKGEAKKVFREIMIGEADADLKIFQETLNELYNSLKDKEKWQELQNICSSLTGTAQMFDFYEIAELMTALEDWLSYLLDKEFFEIEVLNIIDFVPENIHLMIQDDKETNEKAKWFKENVQRISEFLSSRSVVSVDQFKEEMLKIWQTEKPEETEVDDQRGVEKEDFISTSKVEKSIENLLREEQKSSKVED